MTKLEFNLHDPSAHKIVEGCARVFAGMENIKVAIRAIPLKSAVAPRTDGTLEVSGPSGVERFVVEAKRRIEASTLPAVTAHLKAAAKETGLRAFLAADYINENVATRLKADRIGYADTAGNAYLSLPNFYVWLRGFGPIRSPETESRAFQATGAQLVGFLLIKPDAINWNIRRLSRESGVSLGSASHILGDLMRSGHIQLTGERTRRLRDRKELFLRWEWSYLERLRPKLKPRTYRLANDEPLEVLLNRSAMFDGDTILIGGELAAASVTRRLLPERATLHVTQRTPTMKVPNHLRLIPSPDGNVEIIDHFGSGDAWIWPHRSATRFAHPALVHVEMLRHSADGRVQEAMKQLFDEQLAPILSNG